MKTTSQILLVLILAFSISIDVFTLLSTQSNNSKSTSFSSDSPHNTEHSEELLAMTEDALEEIRFLLEQQEERQQVTEKKLHRLIQATHETQLKNTIAQASHSPEYEISNMSDDEYASAQIRVEEQIFSGQWTVENAMEFLHNTDKMSQQQRADLQLQIVRGINQGVITPENIYLPLF